jgi:hypothetical protein
VCRAQSEPVATDIFSSQFWRPKAQSAVCQTDNSSVDESPSGSIGEPELEP